jgi:Patatin-like phospholipase
MAPKDDASDAKSDTTPVKFEQVLREELRLIGERRKAYEGEAAAAKAAVDRQYTRVAESKAAVDQDKTASGTAASGHGAGWPTGGHFDTVAATGTFEGGSVLNAVGLCLSGGGIRSASFCLGVLQALNRTGVLKHVDYLSTVSGGGYIGSSLSAGMSTNRGEFPFGDGQGDTASVNHVRNYSNYLVPNGKIDVLESAVIYLRGLMANVILVLPWLVFAAYITVRSNPTRAHLTEPDLFRWPVREHWPFKFVVLPFTHFNLTAYVGLLLLVLFGLWSLFRSRSFFIDRPDVPSKLTTAYGLALVGLLVVAFFELQPFLFTMIWSGSDWAYNITSWLQRASVALAPLAGLVAFFRGQLQAFIKRATESSGKSDKAAAYLGKIALYAASAVVPLLLWAVYLQMSWWGIQECVGSFCQFPDAPRGVVAAAEWLFGTPGRILPNRPYPMASFYLFCSLVLLLLSMRLSPNANSLHRLYRDRLSKAFLFTFGPPPAPVPRPATSKLGARLQQKSKGLRPVRQRFQGIWESWRRGWNWLLVKLLIRPSGLQIPKEPFRLDAFKLTQLDPRFAPYHLINTALNIQGSKFVNRRGRDADFFLFSRAYVGSEATGYVPTEVMEKVVRELDLGTAMAVSAAAASPSMGSATIRPLTPTLALLNVRVGFWLRNPLYIAAPRLKAWFRELFSLYFLYELIAKLSEKNWNVYVTDGGHLENLGAYELLRRRCRVIIVSDAEADPEMTFGSLVTLQRYARIDLGVRITLPWAEIRDETLRVSDEIAKGVAKRQEGAHCAVGTIEYPNGGRGVLVYIKASMTGDENDYILNYKSRYPQFPHESTGDQFFSEEQFEAYRALGFHAANGFFERRAGAAWNHPPNQERALLDALFPIAAAPAATTTKAPAAPSGKAASGPAAS